MRVRLRKLLAFGLPAVGIVGLLAGLAWPERVLVDLKVVSVQPSGTIDETGREGRLVTLTVSNLDIGYLRFANKPKRVEARVAHRWVQVDDLWKAIATGPHQTSELLLVLPAGTEACRVRFEYEREAFKWRLWRRLGGRQPWVQRHFPRFYKWLWPNPVLPFRGGTPHAYTYSDWQELPPASHWNHATVEVALP